MTVRTTYFGAIGSSVDPAGGAHVYGVVRYPRDFVERVTDRNIPALGPPEDLLDATKTVEEAADANGEPRPMAIAWSNVDFERRYRAHLERPGPAQLLAELRDRACDRDVWLVCWEKDVRWCHRRLLANAIVADLEDVDVGHHPDPTTLECQDDESEGAQDASLADFAGEA